MALRVEKRETFLLKEREGIWLQPNGLMGVE
jgi:hypothetical protein